VTDKEQPYKRSIWDVDKRYSGKVDQLSKTMQRKIGVVQSVESAKKQIPVIPVFDIIKMINAAENLPHPSKITVERFRKCLEEMDSWGADIKTSICILSVLKNGQYPPLDWRIAKAARKKKIVSRKQEKTLNGRSKRKIAQIYVEQLLVGWREELKKVKSAKTLDDRWGRLAARGN